MLLAFSNELHSLIRRDVYLDAAGPWPVVGKTYGYWFWVHTAYSYLLLLASIQVLIETLPRTPSAYRGQPLALLLGMLVPFLGNVAFVAGFGFSSLRGVDVTPVLVGIGGVIVAWGLFRFRLFDIVPVAYDEVFAGLSDGIVVLDAEDKVVHLNPAVAGILGCPPEKAIGRPAEHLVSAVPDWATISKADVPTEHEIPLETEAGKRYYCVQVTPLRTRRGRRIGRVVVLRDTTNHRVVADALRDSERRYRDLADWLPETVFETDITGTLTFANRAGVEQFGYTKEELEKGINVLDHIAPEDRQRARNNMALMLGGGPTQAREYTALRKDGSTFAAVIFSSRAIADDKPVGSERLPG